MKKALPLITFLVVVVAIIAIGYVINKSKDTNSNTNQTASSTTTESANSGEVLGTSTDTSGIDAVALAKYLTSKGDAFYGAYWCPHCQDQKKLFGEEAMKSLTYVECDPKGENAQPDKCTAASIQSYPTWIINGQAITGTKTFSELAQLSGFPR